ncbi:hypothetical protein [Methylomonas albis]|uniref:Uncharacterized protein n=1 Tax=Methylomonas albis TaxID=1854563 RepID=A0ABR9CZV7_9GAMM|nr:hypothetical protein [Methylomonas albis]MBD9355508.1 hypothetical protein [Methylomonas albis]
MPSVIFTRDTAAERSAMHYIDTTPKKPLEPIDYQKIAKKVLNKSAMKIDLDIMIYAGLQWGLYKTDDLEEHLQLKLREWLAIP